MGKGEINRAGAAFGELLQPLDILRLDLPFLGGHFTDGVEVGQGVIDDMGGGQAVQALLEPVGEDGRDTEDFGAGLPQGLHHFDAAAGSGDQILHYDDFLPLFQFALNAVLAAMVLVAGADVAHGQVHQVAHDSGVGDAGGGRAHQHLHIRVMGADQLHQPLLYVRADGGGGEGQAVVAVDGALDAGGPGKGLVRPQEYGTDRQKVMGDLAF